MKTHVNSFHMEYCHRFKVEFQQLLEQYTFAVAIFRNNDLLLKDKSSSYHDTLVHCFGSSFESMALGLSRVWDERRNDQHLISIPNLVVHFEEYGFLGCHCLRCGETGRAKFEALYADPIRMRLRVVRTEALAHSVMVGKSRDRERSQLKGEREFGIINGDALNYCRETLFLMRALNDQLDFLESRGQKRLDEMIEEWEEKHISFLQHFDPGVR